MVKNKNVGAGMALVAGLIGMIVSSAAYALPEVEVGTLPPIVAPNAVNSVDSTVAAPDDNDTQAAAS